SRRGSPALPAGWPGGSAAGQAAPATGRAVRFYAIRLWTGRIRMVRSEFSYLVEAQPSTPTVYQGDLQFRKISAAVQDVQGRFTSSALLLASLHPHAGRMITKTFNSATRQQQNLLAPFEKKTLIWLARRMPRWINSDHLTLLGFLGMALAGGCYFYARW